MMTIRICRIMRQDADRVRYWDTNADGEGEEGFYQTKSPRLAVALFLQKVDPADVYSITEAVVDDRKEIVIYYRVEIPQGNFPP